MAAENLRAGDILQLVNGETVVVELVQHEILENPQTLYNFAVDGNHNYYVAEDIDENVNDFVLVHNEGCRKTSQNQMQEQVKRGQAPKGVERVDPPHGNQPNAQPHVHFGKDYQALNWDGTWHDKGKLLPEITNDIKDWLLKNGWSLPKK